MIQYISMRTNDRHPAVQTAASGFQGKTTASANESDTKAAEQTTTSSIIEVNGCKILVIRRGKIVTMKINLGDIDVQAPEDRAQKVPAQASGKTEDATADNSPHSNRYLQSDAFVAGLAGGLLYTGRA